MESCPLAKKGDCKKSSQESSGESFRHESQTFDCCAFPAKIFDKARKIEIQPPTAEVTETVKIGAPKFSLLKSVVEKLQIHQSFVHNRGDTYLRNRVFRI